MKRAAVVLFVSLAACAPAIVVPGPGAVARTERVAREVEACVLRLESDVRPRFQGVAELSTEPWRFTIAAVVVKHPAGLLVIDPGFGESIAADLRRAGPLVTMVMGTERTKRTVTDALRGAGLRADDVRFAAVTHAHWDHTGGLGDLHQAKVLVARRELVWAQSLTRFFDEGVMPHHLKRAKERTFVFDFSGPAIDGFEGSFDLFGDGAVVAVPLPGHTPGSTGFLIRGAGGVTWLLSGDTTWTSRGVELPAHKSLRTFDSELEPLSSSIGRLAALARNRPDVRVIPAHDADALAALPDCRGAEVRVHP
ncbi:MAG: MBL fold metallo-hydrolase [Myxococcota bacterium]